MHKVCFKVQKNVQVGLDLQPQSGLESQSLSEMSRDCFASNHNPVSWLLL